MRNVGSHLLEDKMDEVVTHYINSHQPGETVHVDANTLALNVQDDAGRVITVMHPQGFSTQMSRQVSVEHVGEGPWTEELMDPEGRLAALVAHLTQHSRVSHHQTSPHHKVQSVRGDVDASVILDPPLRLYNAHTLQDSQSEAIVVQVPHLPPLPPLQEMKRCQETDWFNGKSKSALKDGEGLMESEARALELEAAAAGSPAHRSAHSRKSLPHKKRISRKLKRGAGNTTPQQDIVVINCSEEVPHEEILPDSFVTGVPHQDHLPEDTHHITHEVRPMFICQLCGEFYADEQLKFFQHLKQHYEPHGTIIIENPGADLAIDKMTSTCIVDNVATLPDSIVELSLEGSVPKTLYQPLDKHILYTTSDKTLYTNKVQYSMASMDKEPAEPAAAPEKADLYDSIDKMHDLYSCIKCSRSFRKQKHCEAHMREAHASTKLEDMGEFSEPEDLMEGIHVAVEEGGEQYEQTLLPHLTVENGHVHQEHVRHWYMRNGAESALPPCGADGAYCPVCPAPRDAPPSPQHLKEEVLQRIFETGVPAERAFSDAIIEEEVPPAPAPAPAPASPACRPAEPDGDKKKGKRFECQHCGRVFHHRNSLLYHALSHSSKKQECRECGKGFYTAAALKIHKRVHNGDRPYKCEECGREFRQWSDLKYHKVSLHSDQKHFKCEFCGKEFARKYSLNVHRRIHTGERNYKCEYCNKSFRASSYRLSHMRTHTGDKPYKCSTCEKCFRVAGDLRRHTLTHEKIRNRFEEQKKPKDEKPKKLPKDEPKLEPKIELEISPKSKKHALASTTRPPLLKNLDKKSKPVKKNQVKREGAPNVTVGQNRVSDAQFKMTEYSDNVDVFDTRQAEYPKFKDVYTDPQVEYNKGDATAAYKVKDYNEQIISYKESEQRLTEDRDLAILRPMFRNNLCEVNEKPVFSRTENTDGKMQVFTHVEKTKDYSGPIVSSVTLSDIRNLERERADALHGETIENGFLERLTALYNIPA